MSIERFSASAAAKHMACHASANLEMAIPGYSPPVLDPNVGGAAGAGTDVHKLISDLIKVKHVTATRETKFSAKDMIAIGRALTYIGEVWSTRRFQVVSEQTFKATWLPTPTDTTPDLVLYTKDEIHCIDVKWGKIPVEVVGNEQLLFYDLCIAPLAPKAKGVTNHIVQPRADNIEAWFADTATLASFKDDAIAAQTAILSGSKQFGPSDHCKFCPAYPHSRAPKGSPLCPATMQLLYPTSIDEDEILAL